MPAKTNQSLLADFTFAAILLAGAASPLQAPAQNRAAVERERKEFAEWIVSSPLSPRRAVVVRPIGPGLSLGPDDADIPLAGVAEARLTDRDGRIALRSGQDVTGLSRGRPHTVGRWRLVVSGPPSRSSLTVLSDQVRAGKPPIWFPYDPKAAFTVSLTPPTAPGTLRLLAPDGVDVEATEAGTVTLIAGGASQALTVRRLPGASDEESELEIYFRDGTSGRTTYPAGRFVSLIPTAGGRYLLDFNRARNPFCGYNTVFPCPAPWRGNALPFPIAAGERYGGGGLDSPVH